MELRWGQPVAAEETRIEERDGKQYITGYAAVYYRKDDAGTEYRLWDDVYERILPGAFDRALKESDDVRALFNHNADHLLGRTKSGTLTLRATDRGLAYEIPFDDQDQDHLRVKRKMERGDLTGSSFAFAVDEETWRQDGKREIREITSVRLYDVGPVTYPAYTGTSSGIRSEDLAEVRSSLQTRDDAAAEVKRLEEQQKEAEQVAADEHDKRQRLTEILLNEEDA